MTGKIPFSITINKKACCHLVNMRRQPRNETNRWEGVEKTLLRNWARPDWPDFPKVRAGLRYWTEAINSLYCLNQCSDILCYLKLKICWRRCTIYTINRASRAAPQKKVYSEYWNYNLKSFGITFSFVFRSNKHLPT